MLRKAAINLLVRAIALICLIFGLLAQTIANGQVYAHALFGIFYGLAAIVCGLVSVRLDYAKEPRRWRGWIIAGLGLMLALSCANQLPSTYQRQTKFNDMVKKIQEMKQSGSTPGTAPTPTAH